MATAKNITLALEVVACTLIIFFGLRIFRFQKLAKWCGKNRGVTKDSQKIFYFTVGFQKKILGKPSCLTTSLVLFWLSTRPASLILGVDKGAEELAAHAWVEQNKKIYSTVLDISKFKTLAVFSK